MAKLKYSFRTDILFKLLFTKNQHLLKKLVAHLLKITQDSITEFSILNPEMPPDVIGDKFCRLDILMTVNKQQVNLEVQVNNEGDYPERVLYYWAKAYSNALSESEKYIDLPQVVVINIVNFPLFKGCKEFHSEFQLLEVSRGTQLTNKLVLHFYELRKLPKSADRNDLQRLWLALFKAKTEEELQMIEELGVPEVNEAITEYRRVISSSELREIERQRERARMNEASALHNAEIRAEKREAKKWKGVIKRKDTELAEKDSALADKDSALAEKDSALAEKDALISELKAKLQAANE